MSSCSQRIGVFGGSFDPIHIGHLISARSLAEQLDLQLVLFLPAGHSPLKSGHYAAPEHRLQMVKLAVADNPLFQTCDYEVCKGGASYTVETLKYLHSVYPGAELVLLIGADSAAQLQNWHEYRQLPDLCTIAAAVRSGFAVSDLKTALPVQFCTTPLIDISSTEIRNRLKKRESVQYLLPSVVIEYISANKLYSEWNC